MKRGVITAGLALLLALCLTACGCKHEWSEATCDAPKTCRACGVTEGEVLPHTPCSWTVSEMDYINAENRLVRKCTGCGVVLEEYTSAMDRFHNGIGFLLSAEDFAARLTVKMQELQEDNGEYSAEIAEENGKAQLNIYCTEGRFRETVGELTFGIGGDELDYDRKDLENRYLAVGGILDANHLTVLMPALVQTVDPTMDIPGAFSHSGSWISERSIDCNGIVYDIVAGNEAAVALMIRVDS